MSLNLFNRKCPKVDSFEFRQRVSECINDYLMDNWDTIIYKKQNGKNNTYSLSRTPEHPIFNETIQALCEYEEAIKNYKGCKTPDDKYFYDCMIFDVCKAFVYDLGQKEAEKFAKGILTLGDINEL